MVLLEEVCWKSGEVLAGVYGVRSSDMYGGAMQFRALSVRKSILYEMYALLD